MSLMPDSGWLKALDLKASTLAAIAASCATILTAVWQGCPVFAAFTWVTFFAILGVFTVCLFLARLYDWACDQVDRFWQDHRATRAQRAAAIAAKRAAAEIRTASEKAEKLRVEAADRALQGYFKTLTQAEADILWAAYVTDRQEFPASRLNEALRSLAEKQILALVGEPGPNTRVWPHRISDPAWRLLSDTLRAEEESPEDASRAEAIMTRLTPKTWIV